jgi:hypothetical protein
MRETMSVHRVERSRETSHEHDHFRSGERTPRECPNEWWIPNEVGGRVKRTCSRILASVDDRHDDFRGKLVRQRLAARESVHDVGNDSRRVS